jgi:hypothetical protein
MLLLVIFGYQCVFRMSEKNAFMPGEDNDVRETQPGTAA